MTACKSDDGANCTTSNGWEQGWIVFVDPDDDAQRDDGEDVLQIHEALQGSTLRGNQNVKDYVSYDASGFTKLTNGGFQAGTLVLCDGRGLPKAKAIVINAAGRIRIVDAADAGVTSCTP